jgi:hypothetical protein
MRRKAMVTVSAMILAAQLGSPVFGAEPTAEQLGEITGFLESNDVEGLRNYLKRYPELTEGETTLAQLLRRFLIESVDLGSYLGFREDLSDALDSADDAPAGAAEDPAEPPGEPVY